MALRDHVSDSEGSDEGLADAISGKNNSGEESQSGSVLSRRFRESPPKIPDQDAQEGTFATGESRIAVVVPAPSRPWEYLPFRGATTVDTVLEELERPGEDSWYKIEYEDGREENVSVKIYLTRLALSLLYLEADASIFSHRLLKPFMSIGVDDSANYQVARGLSSLKAEDR